jgi:prophage DNA circulation protein
LTFLYEDVGRAVDLRGTVYEFPDAQGSYVQRTGRSGNRYPLRLIFSGPDHVEQAEDFEQALLAPGVGKLEHPVYGPVDVVPYGDLAREERLVTEGNQTTLELTFYETLRQVYAIASGDPATAAVSAVTRYNDAARNKLLSLGGLVTSPEFKAKYSRLLDDTKSGLSKVAAYSQASETRFNAIYDSVNGGISLLVGDPLTLASQTTSFIESAARAPSRILDRLAAYGNLAASIIQRGIALTPLDLHSSDLFVATHVIGQSLSVLDHTFTTKPEAIGAAQSIAATFDAVVAWRDASFTATPDAGADELHEALQDTVATVTGYLVQLSFTLLQERRVRLAGPRCPLELCAELYGALDEKLQFFIDSNALSWDEHLLIPAGREVVYYV